MLQFIDVICPYCGESFETRVDTSAGSQRYIEDCAVCCRPIELALHVHTDGAFDISASTDRD
ncbi:MAG: CPXCG motif-containing cysteine-rich protein [Rhodanobacteraceae bacterium]